MRAGREVLDLAPNQLAVVDGNRGELQVGVSEEGLQHIRSRRETYLPSQATAKDLARQPAITLDGPVVSRCAVTPTARKKLRAAASGADGIGLLRTEYLFRSAAPQPLPWKSRKRPTHASSHRPNGHLTVRALDAGGDKPVRYISHRHEDNPFLGLRGIRLLDRAAGPVADPIRALQAAASGAGKQHRSALHAADDQQRRRNHCRAPHS